MAQYFTDFSEYTVDATPSDWTKFYATDGLFEVRADAGATGGKVLHCEDQATSGLRGIGWDSVLADADRDDAEIVVRYRLTGTLTYALFNALLRGSGASHTVGSYYAGMQTNNQRRIYKRVSGTGTTIANTTFSPAIGQWLWMRVRMIGDALKVRHWIDGDAEPTETWTFESTETAITAAGYIGIAVGSGTSSPKTVAEVDLIGFGTNGDGAPTSGGGTAPAGTTTIGTITPASTSASVAFTYSAADATNFEYRLDAGSWVSGGATSPLSITGLTASTEYDVELRPTNASGSGASSSPSTFTTSAPATTVKLRIDEVLRELPPSTALVSADPVEVVVLSPTAPRSIVYQSAVAEIAAGVLEIVDAEFEGEADEFEVLVIVSGTVRGLYPATVVDD